MPPTDPLPGNSAWSWQPLAPRQTDDAAEIPWIEPGEDFWTGRLPTDAASAEDGRLTLRLWYAASDAGLHVTAAVSSPQHSPPPAGVELWKGDHLQIGFDAWGNGSAGQPADTRYCGPDDGSVMFALTQAGPQAYAHQLRQPFTVYNPRGLWPLPPEAIRRDAAAGMTWYVLLLPWREFNSGPAWTDRVRIAVLAGSSGTGMEPLRVKVADGADYIPRPGLMRALRLRLPADGKPRIDTGDTRLFFPDQRPEVRLLLPPQASAVTAEGAGQHFRAAVPPPQQEWTRWKLLAPAALGPAQDALHLKLEAEAGSGERCARRFTFSRAETPIRALLQRAQDLAAAADHPLLRSSWETLGLLVAAAWERSLEEAAATGDLQRASGSLTFAAEMLPRLTDAVSCWKNYPGGPYPLFLRTRGPGGVWLGSKLYLPPGWEAPAAYPLVVDLHGGGTPHPIQFLSLDFDPALPGGGEFQRSRTELEPHLLFRPFSGGQRWLGPGEDCFWAQFHTLVESFRTDPARTYLMGESMGGYGTWQIASRSPDRWAAAAMLCGSMTSPEEEKLGMGRNLAGTPLVLHHGLRDEIVPCARSLAAARELSRWGGQPSLVVYRDYGHGLPASCVPTAIAWMLLHHRQRPSSFSFIAQPPQHLGCWGVRLVPQPATGGALPSFTCRTSPGRVELAVENAAAVEIDCGPTGLGIAGDAAVCVNGREVGRSTQGFLSIPVAAP